MPVVERLCKMCENDVETEFHFIFHCAKLKHITNNMHNKVKELCSLTSDTEKLELLNSMPYAFSSFINNLWEERKIFLELP